MPSNGLFKIEIRLVLAAGPHGSGQHTVGRLILLEALGYHAGQAQVVQRPVGGGGKGLRAVAVAGIGRGDAAALLKAAPKIRGYTAPPRR